jgi:diphthine synthase
MLVFIGLGLHDETDISLRGLEEARSCEYLFAEFYTSEMAGINLKKLEGLVGKKIKVLSREDIEEKGDEILKKAEKYKIGLMSPGDPLISTTHVHLRVDAKRRGIETRVVHNSSIYSAAASISGLQNYKFGRSATVATPQDNFFPETPYDVIKENRERGLHTLLFLDIKVDKERKAMSANEAMRVLLEIEKKRGEKVFTDETLCIVLAKVGSFDYVMKAGKVRELLNMDFGVPPHTLIVPGKLHFMEEEYLEAFG